jgi:hypothetical protein
VQRVEAVLVQLRLGAGERVEPLAPGDDRIGLVDAAHAEDVVPERRLRVVRVELRVDDPRPVERWPGAAAPVRRVVVDQLVVLRDEGPAVLGRALRIEAVAEPGRCRAGEHDAGAALLAVLEHALAVPRGDEVERVVGGVLHARPADMRVEVGEIDEARAVAVAARGDRACRRLAPDLAPQLDDLARLDVGAEADDEIREALE